jgi:hypothetical protein
MPNDLMSVPRWSEIHLHRSFFNGASRLFVAGSPYLENLIMTPAGFPSALLAFIQNFDYLRVNKVKVRVLPGANWFDGSSVDWPRGAIAPDADSTVFPSSFDNLLGYGGAKGPILFDREFGISTNPRLLVNGASGAGPNTLLPTDVWYNAQSLTNAVWPVAQLGFAAMAVPPTTSFDVVFEVDFTLRQTLSG